MLVPPFSHNMYQSIKTIRLSLQRLPCMHNRQDCPTCSSTTSSHQDSISSPFIRRAAETTSFRGTPINRGRSSVKPSGLKSVEDFLSIPVWNLPWRDGARQPTTFSMWQAEQCRMSTHIPIRYRFRNLDRWSQVPLLQWQARLQPAKFHRLSWVHTRASIFPANRIHMSRPR